MVTLTLERKIKDLFNKYQLELIALDIKYKKKLLKAIAEAEGK